MTTVTVWIAIIDISGSFFVIDELASRADALSIVSAVKVQYGSTNVSSLVMPVNKREHATVGVTP